MEARGLEPLTFCRKQYIAKQTRYRCAMPPLILEQKLVPLYSNPARNQKLFYSVLGPYLPR